jgi:large subunit ribosomal protein L14
MVFTGTQLYVADNSGGYLAYCVKLVSRPRFRWATVGDTLLVTMKRIRPNRRVKKGELYRALLVNTRTPLRRTADSLAFHQNCVVVLKKDDVVPLASRLKATAPFELRTKGFRRILTMSSFNV